MKYRTARYPIRTMAGVICNGVSRVVHIENVSEGGLRLIGLRSVLAGDVLVLQVLGLQADVEVRWVEGDRCGVEYLANDDHRTDALKQLLHQAHRKKSGQKHKPRPILNAPR